MTEQEVKDTVEQIVKLEQEADELMVNDDYSEADARIKEATNLEKGIGLQGYFLGEAGEDMIVYHKAFPECAGAEWLRYDRANGQWRQSNG